MQSDDDLRITASVVIPAHELTWSFGPSGGPGGQHANRAHTRAEVRFDAVSSSALSSYQRQRIIDRLGATVIVSADDERSQLRNRRLALDRMRQRLAGALRVEPPRRPTRPTRGSIERRLDAKRRTSALKRERRGRPED
jgi:ribosome-associated protein